MLQFLVKKMIKSKPSSGTILIVDDETIVSGMLQAELEDEKYTVYTESNPNDALEMLARTPVDLVISDINMPQMQGYELLQLVRDRYPSVRTALMTGNNIDDYIRIARDLSITNIIPKSTPFNFNEFKAIIAGLITKEIFGLPRYMLPDYVQVAEYSIESSARISIVEEEILKDVSRFSNATFDIHLQLEEIITNAVYHAPCNETGEEKYEKHGQITLEPHELVRVTLGKDAEKYGISVVDTSGRLTKEQVLYRIDRHIHGEGLLDTSGRGIHMSRMFADRLIINIHKNHTTEVLLINYFTTKYSGSKPLYINEI